MPGLRPHLSMLEQAPLRNRNRARGEGMLCADLRGKALFLAQNRLKTGQNWPVLFTDRLTGWIPKLLINSDLQANTG